ncbi:MAG: transglutaminase domain-containing protein [Ruminococcus sp.]|nr:transglutaminase domain-containing protein [Ruminococcus sp.]MBR1393984.1 transglutaminase domain-containing protein [Ruminococcus sp.]
MKKIFIAGLLLCASVMLASCGSSIKGLEKPDSADVPEVTTTVTVSTTATTTTTKATTTSKSVTETETVTEEETTTEELEAPPNEDPEIGYGQEFDIDEPPAVTTQAVVTTKQTTTTTAQPQAVELKVTAKIDQLFSGLRDKEAEAEAARKAQEEKERLEREERERKEQEEREKASSSQTDTSSGGAGDSSGTGDDTSSQTDDTSSEDSSLPQPEDPVSPDASAATSEKEYPIEYTATSYEDLQGYLSFYYEQSVVSKYLKLYPASFFQTHVLALKTVGQAAGKTCELKFQKATGNLNTKTITMDIDRNELKNPEKITSTLLIQVTLNRNDYAKYGTKGISWRFTYKKYYEYPLAVAKLNAYGWDLKTAFNIASYTSYYGHTADMPQDDKTSTEWYAEYGFTYGKGNCYVMAAMFCEMARTLGYECHHISGRVPLARGGYGPHSWAEITVNGKVYVCDPDFTHETGYNGYMINYGQSGTWRYEKISVIS